MRVDGMRVQPLNLNLFDLRQGFWGLALENLFQPAFADSIQDQAVLLAENLLFLLVGKVGTLGLLRVWSGALADAASLHEHLRLQQQVGFAGLALNVIDRAVVLDVGIEAKNHAGELSVSSKRLAGAIITEVRGSYLRFRESGRAVTATWRSPRPANVF